MGGFSREAVPVDRFVRLRALEVVEEINNSPGQTGLGRVHSVPAVCYWAQTDHPRLSGPVVRGPMSCDQSVKFKNVCMLSKFDHCFSRPE